MQCLTHTHTQNKQTNEEFKKKKKKSQSLKWYSFEENNRKVIAKTQLMKKNKKGRANRKGTMERTDTRFLVKNLFETEQNTVNDQKDTYNKHEIKQ